MGGITSLTMFICSSAFASATSHPVQGGERAAALRLAGSHPTEVLHNTDSLNSLYLASPAKWCSSFVEVSLGVRLQPDEKNHDGVW
jgi:hypothetical protein